MSVGGSAGAPRPSECTSAALYGVTYKAIVLKEPYLSLLSTATTLFYFLRGGERNPFPQKLECFPPSLTLKGFL